MQKTLILSALSALVLAGCAGNLETSTDGSGDELAVAQNDVSNIDIKPTGKGAGVFNKFQNPEGNGNPNGNGKATTGNGIYAHGGPVMLGSPNVHLIWYGNWAGNSATSILTDLTSNIGGSPYYNINTTYYDPSNVHVSNAVTYAGFSNDNYSRGTALTDADIQAIVAATNPTDTNGVYFVLTSADVNETSGFCTQYCGWHTHGAINGKDIKYSFVGNPDRCPVSCTNGTASPNGNVGADGMASIFAHELEETTSDPDLNAWYDRRGYENADKCAWTFGGTYSTANGGVANMKLGTRDYLIQQNWVNAAGGYCAKSL